MNQTNRHNIWRNKPLTAPTRKKIFFLLRERGLDGEDDRRAIQVGVIGKASLKDFTEGDGQRLVEHLLGKRPSPQPSPRGRGQGEGNIIELATPEQKEKIRCFAQNDLGWKNHWFAGGRECESISKIIRKHTGGKKHLISQLTKSEAWSVIETLKKIWERKQN